MQTIQVTDYADIATLEVHPLGFVAYAEVLAASAVGAKDVKDRNKNFFRGRILAQAKAYTAAKKLVELTPELVSQMPFPYAVKMKEALDDAMTESFLPGELAPPVAKVLSSPDANGVTSEIVVRLGTPIKFGGDRECTELSFLAKTLGQLEDVLAEDTNLSRTIELLKIAKPFITGGGEFLTLPSTAIAQVTLSDGTFIMQNVTNRFFPTPTDSTE